MPTEPTSEAAQKQRRRYAPRMPPEKRRGQLIDAALSVIIEHGYEGVSIEAIARTAGVTRPVIYDHFTNLGELLEALIEREERYALEQLSVVVVNAPSGAGDPAEFFAGGVRRFLDAVQTRPETWRVILLPPEGTPATVRQHVETNRGRIQERIEDQVRWAIEQSQIPADLDVEICARAIRSLTEEAGRMVLTDPERFSPERYERFALDVLRLIWSR